MDGEAGAGGGQCKGAEEDTAAGRVHTTQGGILEGWG